MSTPGKYVILMHLHLNDSIAFKDLENILRGNILFEDLNNPDIVQAYAGIDRL